MRIAFLISEPLRNRLFQDETIANMRGVAELVFLDGAVDDRAALRQTLAGADVAVSSWGTPSLDAGLLDAAPNLRLVLHAAGSVKPIVSDALFARGIRVISSAVVLSEGVSEFALGQTIAAVKDVFQRTQDLRAGLWHEHKSRVRELYGLTVGVVGCGFAGAHYIELLKPFRVNTLVYDPFVSDQKLADLGARRSTLDELLTGSDVVSLHAPSIPETRHLVNRRTLSLMKPDAILINTARGSLIDEAALAEALQAGKLRYALIDVTDPEPPAADSPLRQLENCILTPHIAGLANNGQLKIGDHVWRELQSFIADRPSRYEVRQSDLATMA